MAFQAAIEGLQAGRIVMIKPKGTSMEPIIKSGQSVMLVPAQWEDVDLKIGDIVLVKVKGSVYLHKITAMDGDRVQIGNNRGHINGWTTLNKVYGKWWEKGSYGNW